MADNDVINIIDVIALCYNKAAMHLYMDLIKKNLFVYSREFAFNRDHKNST